MGSKQTENDRDFSQSAKDRTITVTLNEQVSVPSKKGNVNETEGFECAEMSMMDEFMEFYGLNIAPDDAALLVAKENVRGVYFKQP